jgi:hypothetical protein
MGRQGDRRHLRSRFIEAVTVTTERIRRDLLDRSERLDQSRRFAIEAVLTQYG